MHALPHDDFLGPVVGHGGAWLHIPVPEGSEIVTQEEPVIGGGQVRRDNHFDAEVV